MSTPGWRLPWPILLGLAGLYLPIYVDLWQELWQTEANGHAPLIALVVAWLFWHLGARLAATPAQPCRALGPTSLILGLLLAWLGYAHEQPILAMLSQPPVLAGILLLQRGHAALRLAVFPLLYLAFMVPIPGMVLDSLTTILKESLSGLTVELLYALGYPVARSGVVIQIGQYQMLVADACSGLYSLVSLTGLGVLFTHLARRRGWHGALLLASIVPVALLGNLLRIVMLVLITFHFGDAIGRQWHTFTGLGLFLVTGLTLLGLDHQLVRLFTTRSDGVTACTS